MDLPNLLIIVIAVLAIGGVAVWYFLDRRRRAALRERFGPEYERTVRATGDRKHAERELEHRAERVRKLDIRPLAPEQRARFAEEWRSEPTLGYTHYQPAQLTTVGKRATLWCYEWVLDLEEIEARIEALKFRGAKGTRRRCVHSGSVARPPPAGTRKRFLNSAASCMAPK